MSRKMTTIPVNHGMLNDTIDYKQLMKEDSETLTAVGDPTSFQENKMLVGKIGESKETPKQKVYSKRRLERNTQKDIYCGKRK